MDIFTKLDIIMVSLITISILLLHIIESYFSRESLKSNTNKWGHIFIAYYLDEPYLQYKHFASLWMLLFVATAWNVKCRIKSSKDCNHWYIFLKWNCFEYINHHEW